MSPIFACQMAQLQCNSMLYRASFLFVLGGLVGPVVLHSAWVFILSNNDSDNSSAIPSIGALCTVSSSEISQACRTRIWRVHWQHDYVVMSLGNLGVRSSQIEWVHEQEKFLLPEFGSVPHTQEEGGFAPLFPAFLPLLGCTGAVG